MTDWSDPMLEAKIALKRAENSFGLSRWHEGLEHMTKAQDEIERVFLAVNRRKEPRGTLDA